MENNISTPAEERAAKLLQLTASSMMPDQTASPAAEDTLTNNEDVVSRLTLEALNQSLQNQGQLLESYFTALKGQSDNKVAHFEALQAQSRAQMDHFQALQAQSVALEQHMEVLKSNSVILEDYSKTLEAHGKALTSLFEGFQSITTQLQILPGLLNLVIGMQGELDSGFSFRPGTFDRNIFRAINYKQYNEYRLPETFNPEDIIIDIGAHIGCFTYACLDRKADHIYSYEAFAENMQILQRNLERFGTRVELNHKAVWSSDMPASGLTYLRDTVPEHRGLGVVDIDTSGLQVESVGLDDILERFERVRLLKVDCDRSEYVVLLTSRLLNRVEAICIEYEDLAPVPEFMGLSQYSILNRTVLENYLHEQGFNTEHRPTVVDYQGFIFASRNDLKNIKVWG